MTSSKPNYLPKALLLNIITLEVRILPVNFVGRIKTFNPGHVYEIYSIAHIITYWVGQKFGQSNIILHRYVDFGPMSSSTYYTFL